MELCTAAICLKTASGMRCFGSIGQEGLMPLVGCFLTFVGEHVIFAQGRTDELPLQSATVRQGRTDELPLQEHGTGRSFYPADKVSIAVPSRSV